MIDLVITILIAFISAGLMTSWSETLDQAERMQDAEKNKDEQVYKFFY